jgi:hypothetical protein
VVETGGRGVNTCNKCVHMHVNPKMITVEIIPGRGNKGQ